MSDGDPKNEIPFKTYYHYYFNGLMKGMPPKEAYKYLTTLNGPAGAVAFLVACAAKGIHISIDANSFTEEEKKEYGL